MLNYDVVKSWPFARQTVRWQPADAARYALSLNFGQDPLDSDQIALATGQSEFLFPTMISVMGRPGHWLADPRTGVDHSKMLIGEVSFEQHHPLPAEGEAQVEHEVLSVHDKGEGRGALVLVERRLRDSTGRCTLSYRATSFCRADGGFSGGSGGDPYEGRGLPFPENSPAHRLEVPTLPQQALLFALNGDYNAIHIDPAKAARSGLAAPVLHGMGTVGLLAAALLRAVGDPRGLRMRSLAGRFSAPVLPGQTLELEWLPGENDQQYHFRAREKLSQKIVFDAGLLSLQGPSKI